MSRTVRTAPLTDVETRAGLKAVGRVLDAARDRARWEADADRVADLLDRAGELPACLAQPELFRNKFRPTLEGLADSFDELGPVLAEFDRATNPTARRPRPEADLWRDCGSGE